MIQRLGLLTLLAGCTGQSAAPRTPAGPHLAATEAGIDALCMLVEGAGRTCERGVGTATFSGKKVGLSAVVESVSGPTVFQALHLRIDVSVDGVAHPELTTFTIANGSEEPSALKKGFHEWAVIAGVAVADLIIDDPARPALRALEPETQPVTFDGFAVYRGFPVVRVGKSPVTVDHEAMASALTPITSPLAKDQWHTLDLRLNRAGGKDTWTCHLDGEPSEPLCTLAATYAWPNLPAVSAKVVYVLGPAGPTHDAAPFKAVEEPAEASP